MKTNGEFNLAIYTEARLAELGVSLAEFLKNPAWTLERVGQGGAAESMAKGFRPLLPAQALVAQRVMRRGA